MGGWFAFAPWNLTFNLGIYKLILGPLLSALALAPVPAPYRYYHYCYYYCCYPYYLYYYGYY